MAPYAWVRFICTQTDIEDRTKACCQLIVVLDAQGVDFSKTPLDAPHDLRTSPYPTPRISLEGAHIVLRSIHIFFSYGLLFCPCFFFLSTRFSTNMYSQVVRYEKILYHESQGPSYIDDGFVFHLCMDDSVEDVVIERTEEIYMNRMVRICRQESAHVSFRRGNKCIDRYDSVIISLSKPQYYCVKAEIFIDSQIPASLAEIGKYRSEIDTDAFDPFLGIVITMG
ncbi:hypothetical protein BCR41DRAFT_388332 [Lobosporangium transversale]|uniref:Uncharacterized protein n=1 Tax=Lobosporangium transversale TaxID=64571 RepID=A0A1Y2GJP0_9FUNG|nr:hypothetical protein BCR41DRAFT_388332 [Lobosporangium transversale]ORZ09375.1 hypothetical protein BCR41DRAFT_388332 [Lobosporangium transversale]|eukprot:XP_021878828.1 hypothetical protein BCR41DRAFT_388332 [Lobosporangium transversale]